MLTLQRTFIEEIVQVEESVSRGQVLNEALGDRKATEITISILSDVLVHMTEQCVFIWNVMTEDTYSAYKRKLSD